MILPLKIALYFICFAGLFIPCVLVLLIYPVERNVSIFPKLLPFPLFATISIVSILIASASGTKTRLLLSIAAIASLPLAVVFALSIDSIGILPVPGFGVIGLFPAVILMEEAHCAERRRRRALVARRALGEDGGDE